MKLSEMMSEPTSRRTFLARASVAGLAIPAAGALLSACGSAHSTPNSMGAATASAAATVAPPPFKLYDPSLPPAGSEKTKQFSMSVRDVTIGIADGVAMKAWTFDGTVPGPTLRARVGDMVEFTLRNDGSTQHSVDFHSAQINWKEAYRIINPGESISFSFTPKYAGAFMYHCGTMPMLHHIASGMFGAMVIDPVEPLPPAKEFMLVHNEYYVTNAVPDMAKMLAVKPDYVTFNGYAFQYKDNPIKVKLGDLVRFYVVNAGPTLTCAFHAVGEQFDTVYLGAPPESAIHGVQTFNVPPGGGMVFEIEADVVGQFPLVNHSFAYTETGAVALLQVDQ
jgi:nitrite reductase (NO-forming)